MPRPGRLSVARRCLRCTHAGQRVAAPASPQPWIVSLLAVHAAIALLALLTRRKPNVQAAMFLVVCGAVYSAQYLNGALARRWRELGFTQDYFDDRGVFISFVYSLPLLVMCGAMMVRARCRRGADRGRRDAAATPPYTARRPPAPRPPALRLSSPTRNRLLPPQLNAFFTSIELLVKVKRAELRRGAAGARPAAPSPLTDGGGGAAAAGTATAPSPAVKRTTRSSAAASGKKA